MRHFVSRMVALTTAVGLTFYIFLFLIVSSHQPSNMLLSIDEGETRPFEIGNDYVKGDLLSDMPGVNVSFFSAAPPKNVLFEKNETFTRQVNEGNFTYLRAYLTKGAWIYVQWNTTGTRYDYSVGEGDSDFQFYKDGFDTGFTFISWERSATTATENVSIDYEGVYYIIWENEDVDGNITVNATIHGLNYNLSSSLHACDVPCSVDLVSNDYSIAIISKSTPGAVMVDVTLSKDTVEMRLQIALLIGITAGIAVVVIIAVLKRKKKI